MGSVEGSEACVRIVSTKPGERTGETIYITEDGRWWTSHDPRVAHADGRTWTLRMVPPIEVGHTCVVLGPCRGDCARRSDVGG